METPIVHVVITTDNEQETIALGSRLGTLLPGGAVVILDGDLGAGKTRFSKGVAAGLGVKQELTSPTFNLVLEYPLEKRTASEQDAVSEQDAATKQDAVTGQGAATAQHPGLGQARAITSKRVSAATNSPQAKLLRHFDLYRLESAEQLEDLDYFGLIEQTDAVSLVEWGSRFTTHLPLDYLQVSLLVDDEEQEKRRLEFSAVGPLSTELLSRFVSGEEA